MLLLTLVGIIWLIIWALAVVDIVRRHDQSRGQKAAWAIFVLLIPVIGVIIYLVVRPPEATAPRFPDGQGAPAPTSQEALERIRDRRPT